MKLMIISKIRSLFAAQLKSYKTMNRQQEIGKKLSLKKIQITRLNVIRGGDNGDVDTKTNGDTTTSSKCPTKNISQLPPVVILGSDDGSSGSDGAPKTRPK